MPENKQISRLLHYRVILNRLYDLGFETVFSYGLAKEAGVSPEQVRKDFSKFGIKGNKKGGYNIQELLESIGAIFHKDEQRKVILIGTGNLGTALINYKGFAKNMINIAAAFDIDPVKYRKKIDIPVYPMEKLKEVVDSLEVKTAIVAIPQQVAQEVCTQLVDSGITGILNFTPAILKVPENVYVYNIQICNALESLIYKTIDSNR